MMIAAAAALFLGAGGPVPDVTVRFAGASLERVGTLRMGLLCVPTRGIRGGRFLAALRRDAEHVLREVVRAEPAPLPPGIDEIEADVHLLTLRICAPGAGLGDRTSVKGRVAMAVRWTVRFADGAAHDVMTSATVDWRAVAGADVDLVEAVFAENIRAMIRRIRVTDETLPPD